MKQDPRKLYVLHDSRFNLYKIGSSARPKVRMQAISKCLGYTLDLEFVTPGHDFFLKRYELPRVRHPIAHPGETEWYIGNEETTDFLLMIWNDPSLAAKTRTA